MISLEAVVYFFMLCNQCSMRLLAVKRVQPAKGAAVALERLVFLASGIE